MLLDPIPVHLGAIAAVEIANVPVALDKLKLAMTAGNVGEPEDDIRTLSAPDGQDGLEKRNRITAADRMEFAEHEARLPRSKVGWKVGTEYLRGYVSVRWPSIFWPTFVAGMIESSEEGNGTGVDRAIVGRHVPGML